MTINMSYTQNKPQTSATLNPMHNIHQNWVCLKTCLNFFAYKYSKKNQQEQLNKYACCHQNKCTFSIVVQLCLWFVFFVWVTVYQKSKFNPVESMGQSWVGLRYIISDYGTLAAADRSTEKS